MPCTFSIPSKNVNIILPVFFFFQNTYRYVNAKIFYFNRICSFVLKERYVYQTVSHIINNSINKQLYYRDMMHLSVDNNAPFTFANMYYYYIKKYDQTHNYLILTSQKCHKYVSQKRFFLTSILILHIIVYYDL